MKLSGILLLILSVLLITSLFASNWVLKKEYDKMDTSDPYWTYQTIHDQPFRYLKIEGGNYTHIAFETHPRSSVRMLKRWGKYNGEIVHTITRNDTLFINFPEVQFDETDKNDMGSNVLLRVFTPDLQAVSLTNTNCLLLKFPNPSLKADLKGKSTLDLEFQIPKIDALQLFLSDSSTANLHLPQNNASHPAKSERLSIRNMHAHITGISRLDMGNAQIEQLNLSIADTSTILLSGNGLQKYHPAAAQNE